CTCPRKRALRGRASSFQAHHRKDRAPDRIARPRVLRKADRRAQAQEGRRGEASLQAHPQPAAAAEAVLRREEGRTEGRAIAPFCFSGPIMTLKNRITEDMKTAMRAQDTASRGAT